ncbi:MAG: gamma-glutamylcyclotransferase family protein [Chloroflexota bacterium]
MYYFAYASNLNRKLMQTRCPDCKPKFGAILPNYRLVFVGWSRQWRGAKATIRSFRGEKVVGAVYEISNKDLARLDNYEGYPREYKHLNVTVFTDDDRPVEAITYIKTGAAEDARPSPEYLATIKQGYRDWGIE